MKRNKTTRIGAGVSAVALLGAGLIVATQGLPTPAGASPTPTGNLTVIVFQDFNADGDRDTSKSATSPAYDEKVAGATVRAICVTDSGADTTIGTEDDLQATVTTTTQDGSGDYVLAAPGSPCRVEVSPPAGYEDGAVGTTQVAFVNTVPSTLSVGINRPQEFCQDNPDIFVSCFTTYSYGSGPYRSIKTFPWQLMSDPDGHPSVTWVDNGPGPDPLPDPSGVLANQIVVGSVFGIAADIDGNRVFSSAYFKAGAKFGPSGTGAIYATDITTAATTLYADLNTIYGPSTAGANNHNFASTPAARIDLAGKTDAMKVALGDLELSNDGTKLYVSNLANQHIYALPTTGVVDSSTVTDIAPPTLPGNCPTAGDLRVMGLGKDVNGVIHLGGVCTGESTASNDDLHSYVWSLTGTTWSLVFNAGLPDDDTAYVPPSPGLTSQTQARYWRNGSGCSIVIFFFSELISCPSQIVPPQYIISDVSFDGDNAMILSYRDRQNDMYTVPESDSGGVTPIGSTTANATIRRVCRLSASDPWIEETGMTCGGKTSGPEVPAVNPVNDVAGDEFYWGDRQGDGGWESGTGGAVQLGGWPVIGTTVDPQTINTDGTYISGNAGTGGVNAFDNTTGGIRGALDVILSSDVGSGFSPANFGKMSSMGDVDALCDRAPVEIGNRLWVDTDTDGIQDPGEASIAGQSVSLFEDGNADGVPDGPAIATVTTDSSGNYLFSSDARFTDIAGKNFDISSLAFDKNDVTANRYIIGVPTTVSVGADVLPLTDKDTTIAGDPGNSGGTSDEWVDSDFFATNGYTETIQVLGAGRNDHRYDAGYGSPSPKVGVGNLVWEDLNNDGDQDPGELGIPNVTVRIFADANNDGVPDGAAIQTISTDANGHYLFEGLDPGLYVIETDIPVGHISSTGTNGAATGPFEGASTPDPDLNPTDSDDNGSTAATVVRSKTFDLQIGTEPTLEPPMPLITPTLPDADGNLTVDFGFFRPVGVGNFVWIDTNNNGRWDTGELPYENATVRIYADFNNDGVADGAVISTTSTDSAGHYSFTRLIPGTYLIEMVLPSGYSSSTGTNGSATGPFEGASTPDPDTTVDADTGSSGDDNGTALSATLVRAKPITLSVGGETGDGDLDDSFNRSVDFGIFRPARLGDLLWLDNNNDGQQDPGEPGVPDVTVTLFDAATNTVVQTTSTDASGNYLFNNLIPGSYYVVFDASDPDFPAQHTFTTQDQGADNTDSDVNPITGRSGIYPLAAGDANLSVDAGIYSPGPILSLGNLIWADYNDDGNVDSGEPGIAGVVVDLFIDADNDNVPDSATPLASQTTNAAGQYLFTGLEANNYIVRVSQVNWNAGGALENWASSTPTSADPDDDVDNDDNGVGAAYAETSSLSVTLSFGAEPTSDGDGSADSNLSVDFGFVPDFAELGNKVWYDTNRNGIQDGAELPVPNVTVKLFRAGDDPATATPVDTEVTDASGLYLFTDLLPGDYFVQFVASTLPANWTFTTAESGGDNNIDSDANAASGLTEVTTLSAGESDLTWDAGIVTTATIGDFVWLDVNRDGIQDPGEAGLGNVTVKLVNATTGVVVATTTTNSSGFYLFQNVNPVDDSLTPIQYRIEFVTPAGYSISPKNVGGVTSDSDAGTDGKTATTTLDPLEDDRTWDMGVYLTPIDVSIVKTLDGKLVRGRMATYFLDVTNKGPIDTVFSLTVVDDLPAGLGYVSATGDGWSCGAAGQKVTCSRTASLAVGAMSRITLTVTVSADAGASIANLATVATVSDQISSNNQSVTPSVIVESEAATNTPVTPQTPTRSTVGGNLPTTGAAIARSLGLLGLSLFFIGLVTVRTGRRKIRKTHS